MSSATRDAGIDEAFREAFRMIFRHLPSPTWAVTADRMTVCDANDAAIQLLGIAKDRVLALSVADIEKRCGVLAMSPLPLLRDGHQMMLATPANTGARLQADLTASIARRDAMAATASFAIIETDARGIVMDWNPGATAIFGYAKTDMIGRSLASIMPERLREQHLAGMQRVADGGASRVLGQSLRLEGLHKNGNEFPIELTISAWESPDGPCFTGIIRDVTVQQRSEELFEFLAFNDWTKSTTEFLPALTEFLGRVLGVDYVIVDRLRPGGMVETVAIYARGEAAPNLEYDLRGTPCSDVITRGLCHFPANVHKLFPEDELLARMGAESYLGIPLQDSRGVPIGLLLIMDSKEMPDVALATALMKLSSVRAAAELERLAHLDVIHEKAATLEHVLRRSNLASYVVDYTARTWDGTPALHDLCGIDEHFEKTFAGWRSLLHPDDRSNMLAHEIVLTREQQVIVDRTLRIVRANDGEERWVHELGAMEYDAGGRPLRKRGTLQDVTAQRQTDAQVQRQAALINAASDAIYVLGLDGTVTFWNDGAERMYGWSRAEVLGRRISDIDVLARSAIDTTRSTVLAQKGWTGELHRHSKSGTAIAVDCRWTMLNDQSGQPNEILAIDTDITEEIQLRAQLQQAQKIESVGQLAGGIAHDFNNLLTVISGGTELALTKLEGESPLRDELLAVRQASARAGALTRQLLAFSRKQIMQLEVLSLAELVTGLEDMLRRTIGERITLKVDMELDVGNVRADRGQIEQVIVNLVVNSRDAMPDGGVLTIAVRSARAADVPHAEPGDEQRKSMAIVEVRDTGIGMDAITRGRIFEPFFSTKPTGQGTGLGLPTVHGIVSQSGGSVLVDSTPGVGTVVTVLLPRVEQPATVIPVAPVTMMEGRETILLVEDDGALRKLAARILRRAGYRVLEAASGDQALEIAAGTAETIDLMVTDVVMPGLSGPEVAERLCASRPKMRVLFSSGYADDALLQRGVPDMNRQFLHKPYSPADFTRRVRLLLDEKRLP